ncbi:CRISPR-associated endonuclease Cas2 [uncultured Megasphaera sp.]|uniref:CRISPR-associated endonuclease Cas2 n=1 Tax=uncultured Megasphaera sp. TaxID=165188 RepID=UPI0025E2C131|nr:CRISPR-associated endonuclease Cas2 [uncultured Megasphaera sp.]
MSKFMRLLVMFDLPVKTKMERKAANQFRHFLLHDGYYMMQFSVYVRICNGRDAVEKHRQRILHQLPPQGSVRMLIITERQFEAMEILCGRKIPELDEKQQQNTVMIL